MKWNVDEMSPIIDGIISVSIFIVLLWAIPDDWFANARPVEHPNFIILTVIIYNIGIWSGRRVERNKRGNQ